MDRDPRFLHVCLERPLYRVKAPELRQERRVDVQDRREPFKEDRRQDPHVTRPDDEGDVVGGYSVRELAVVVLAADEARGVDVLDRHPARRALSKAKAAFLSPATTASSPGRRRGAPAGSSPSPRRARRNETPLVTVQPNSIPPPSTTSPMRHAAHPAPRSVSSPASPLPWHDGAEPYAEVEDAAHLALGDVAEGRIRANTGGSSHDEG